MADAIKVFLLTLSALFPIVDPLTGSPIFLAFTEELPSRTRKELSWRVALNSLFLMVGSYFVGAQVLRFFGISLPVIQVGGGLVVVSAGWGILMAREDTQQARERTVQTPDVFGRAFYPLTLPLTVGPGSISVAVTLGANSTHHYGFHIAVLAAALVAMFLIAVSIFLCYGFSDRLGQLVGKRGMAVILRLSSFLLVCIGVQIIWNGLSALLASLPLYGR
jgi:multiple antibiotic resistance protein